MNILEKVLMFFLPDFKSQRVNQIPYPRLPPSLIDEVTSSRSAESTCYHTQYYIWCLSLRKMAISDAWKDFVYLDDVVLCSSNIPGHLEKPNLPVLNLGKTITLVEINDGLKNSIS